MSLKKSLKSVFLTYPTFTGPAGVGIDRAAPTEPIADCFPCLSHKEAALKCNSPPMLVKYIPNPEADCAPTKENNGNLRFLPNFLNRVQYLPESYIVFEGTH